jgi:hypothetical protein
MSNVVALFKPTPNPVKEFISNELFSWAIEQGLDIESADFKFTAATIMVELQGMLCSLKN